MLITGDLKDWLPWVIKIRFLIITFVFAIQFTLGQWAPGSTDPQSLTFLSIAIVIWYVLGLFYLIYNQLSTDYLLQAYLQIFLDIILITSVIHFTGDLDSIYISLYLVAILMWSVLLPRGGALLVAAVSFIAMGALLELAYLPKLLPGLAVRYSMLRLLETHSVTQVTLPELQVKIFGSFFGFFAVAYLSSFLAEMQRKTGVELQDQRGRVASLQALNQNIIDSMREGLVTTDLEGRITRINPAAEMILDRKNLIGISLQDILPEIDPHLPFREAGYRQELMIRTPVKKEKRVLEVSVSLLTTPQAGAVGYVYNFNDFTEEKKRESEYRMKDRMATLGRLSAGIAHEIRNPLASMVGSVKLLRSYEDQVGERGKLIDIVSKESERLNKIVSDFLIYARDHDYEFGEVNVVEILDETLLLLQNHPAFMEKHKIERAFPDEGIPAWVDSNRIRQVFWNICTNSLKAMPEGGTLSVGVRPGRRETVRIAIADTGIGFSDEQLEKLFEPFQSFFPDGTGLGLAIAQQVIRAHKGRIWAESESERGACFTIELPRRLPTEAQAVERQSAVPDASRR